MITCNVGDFVEFKTGIIKSICGEGVVMSKYQDSEFMVYRVLRVSPRPFISLELLNENVIKTYGHWNHLDLPYRQTVLTAVQNRLKWHQKEIDEAQIEIAEHERVKQGIITAFDLESNINLPLEQPRTLNLEEL